nr:uncharacterized protein CI109_007235 [Kwoniella shandongensis]KAA5524443.1 hypothetical protein CI109_007235 [Kwoniella shandongensis]
MDSSPDHVKAPSTPQRAVTLPTPPSTERRLVRYTGSEEDHSPQSSSGNHGGLKQHPQTPSHDRPRIYNHSQSQPSPSAITLWSPGSTHQQIEDTSIVRQKIRHGRFDSRDSGNHYHKRADVNHIGEPDDDDVVCVGDNWNRLAVTPNNHRRMPIADTELHFTPSTTTTACRSTHEEETEYFNLDPGRPGMKRGGLEFQEASSDDDDDIDFVGMLKSKRQKRIHGQAPSGGEVESTSDTPLRALSPKQDEGCSACGCKCGGDRKQMTSGHGSGSGSTTLSLQVRANILTLLLGSGESLFNRLRSAGCVNDWKDIASMVGAAREDYDRVRFCAKSMQDTLPGKMRRGIL